MSWYRAQLLYVAACFACRPAPLVAADSAAPAEPAADRTVDPVAAAAPSEAWVTGLAECDFFLDRYEACIDTLEPAKVEAAQDGLETLKSHFLRGASEDPEKARIECAHAIVEQRKQEQTGCDWSGGPPVETLATRWVSPAADSSPLGLRIVETTGDGLDGPISGRLVRARFNKLRPCLDPAVGATFTLTLKIDASGVATESVVESAELSSDSVGCLEAVSQGWKFPTPASGSATVISTIEMVGG